MPKHTPTPEGSHYNVMANELDRDIVDGEFELSPLYDVHFRKNSIRKGMNPSTPTSYWLNSTTIVFVHGWLWNEITTNVDIQLNKETKLKQTQMHAHIHAHFV